MSELKIYGTKTEEQIIKLFPNNSILIAYRGSIAHNMYVPNSDPNSVDDVDLMGVHLGSIDTYIGLLKAKETIEKFVDEYDVVSYEFRKMISLLLKSNPNVLSILYLKPEHYLFLSEVGQLLLSNREYFSSLIAYDSFVGYASSQIHRMERYKFEGYMGSKRKAIVDKFGYDCKAASHAIRLLRMGIEFLETGVLNVYRKKDVIELLDIKLGKYLIDEVKAEAEYLFNKASRLKQKSFLPKTPNFDAVNNLTRYIMYDYIVKKMEKTL